MQTWMYLGIATVISFILAMVFSSLRIKRVHLKDVASEDDDSFNNRRKLFNTLKWIAVGVGIILAGITVLQFL